MRAHRACVGVLLAGLCSGGIGRADEQHLTLSLTVPEAQALTQALAKVGGCGVDVQAMLLCQQAANLMVQMQQQFRAQMEKPQANGGILSKPEVTK